MCNQVKYTSLPCHLSQSKHFEFVLEFYQISRIMQLSSPGTCSIYQLSITLVLAHDIKGILAITMEIVRSMKGNCAALHTLLSLDSSRMVV